METKSITSITIAMFEDREKIAKALNDNFSVIHDQNQHLISKANGIEFDIKDMKQDIKSIKKDLKSINEKLDILLSR
jgi:uncharacterized protein (UPF0335 family)